MRYDFFVSYAREDGATVAEPLARALRAYDFEVFLDSWELLPGDSLHDGLDDGLRGSRCGLVVVSDQFISKHYPRQELRALQALAEDGTRIVPVLHDIEPILFRQEFPTLADRVWLQTSHGIDALAQSLYDLGVRAWGHQALRRPGEYLDAIPLRAQIFDDACAAIERLLQPETWPRLRSKRDVSMRDEWMGTDDDVLIELGFRIYLPALIAQHYRALLVRNRSTVEPASGMVIDVLGVARQALVEEKRLADASEKPIIYNPRVPAWRRLREQDPVQHLWQGISEERLGECAELMERRTGGTLVYAELSDWIPVYREVYEKRGSGYQPLGLLYNALYRFEPAIRPVLMRLLALWRGLYEIASQDWKEPADSQRAFDLGLEQFAKALEVIGRDRLYEMPTTTLAVARNVATALAPRSLGLPAR